jgi:opacity protein-like surface antigen
VRVVVKVAVMMVLALPAVARAQDAPKGYLQGMVGAAHTEETDTAYAGLGAWRINSRLHIFGEVGRMRNVIGPDLAREAAEVETQLIASNAAQFNTTFPVDFEARVPTWYGLGGVRAQGPSRGKLTTYVEGGVGTARLDPQVHLTINGENLDNEAAALTGLDDDPQKLEFIAGGGAGVAFQVWKRIRIEGGYRYMRLFGDDKTNINRIHVGAGWSF